MPILGEQEDFMLAPELQAMRERQRSQLKTSTALATQRAPDQEAEILSLSQQTGLAPELVRGNIDKIRARIQTQDPTILQMPKQSPKTALFLSNPSNAAVAQDDHPTLTSMEQMLTYGGNFLKAARVAIPQFNVGFYGRLQETGELLGKYIAPPTGPFAQGAPFKWLAEKAAAYRKQSEAYAQQLMPKAQTQTELDIYAGAASAAQNLLYLPFAALGGMAGGAQLATKSLLGVMGTIAGGQAYGVARDQGASIERAALYEGLQTASEVLTEKIPASTLIESWGKAGGLKLLGTELFQEGWTEELNTIVGDLADWALLPENKTKTFGDYLRARPSAAVSTAIQTIVGVGAQVGAVRLANKVVQSMGAVAKESPLLKRAPDKLREHIENAAEGTGLEKVYIDPEAIREYAATRQVDPAAVAELITEGGAQLLAEATVTGQSIEVPIGDYVTRVGVSEHAAYFDQVIRPGSPLVANEQEVTAAAETALVDLTPEEIAQQETIQANIAQLESPEVATAVRAGFEAEPTPTPEPAPSIEGAIAEPVPVESFIDRIEREAKQRIRERGTLTGERLGAGVDPFDIADVVIIGAAKVARGVQNFAQWSQAMIGEYGPQVRPYLRTLYAKSVAEATSRFNLPPEAVKEAAASVVIDNAVTEAEQDAAAIPLYTTAAEAGMSEEDFAKYEVKMKQASLERRTKLEAEYRKSFARELTDYYQAKKEETRQAVAAELNQSRDQQALAYLQKGTQPNGDALEIPVVKLDQKALEQQYGKHKESPVMQGLRRIDAYRTEGGEHPDLVGERLGYESGDEMVRAVIATPKFDDAVKTETERRMAEQYGDLLTDGTLDQKARDAAMLLGRAEMAADETKALLKAMKENGKQGLRDIKAIRVKDARAAAERKVSAMPVRSLNPRLHYAAARKASMKALEAFQKGDMEAAWLAKNQEITNVEMYRATRNALDRINEARSDSKAYFRNDEQLAKTRDMAFVEGARAIASRLFFPNRAATVDEAMARIQKHDPQNYAMVELLLPPLPVQDWSQAPYGAVEDMLDAADHLWEMSRRDKQARINMELIDRAELIEKLNTRLRELPARYRGLGEKGDLTPSERIEGILLGAKAWNRRVESLITELDGGPEGPFRDFFWNTVRDQTTTFRVEKTGYMRQLHEILKPIQDTLTKTKIAAPELGGFVFGRGGASGKAQLLGAMLHMGNRKQPTSNMVKFLVNRGWGTWDDITGLDTSTWDGFIKRMEAEGVVTKADYDFLQAVWDLFDSMKPLLQKSHMEQYGFTFEEVTADPFTTSFGTYRGGYVPALIDPLANQPMKLKAEKEMVFEDKGHLAFPSAGRGSTISRVVTMDPEYRLAMNLQFLPQHIDWALRFAYIQPAVKDVTKIVTDKTFRSNLNAFDPGAGSDILIPWLSRAATQRISETGKWKPLDRFFTVLRNNVAMQVLTVNVGNAMQNVSGAFLAAVKIENRRFLANGLWRFVRAPMETAAYIRRQSAYMQTALDDSGRELQNQIQDILLNPSIYAQAKQFVIKHGQFLSTATQHLLSQVVWLAAREDAEARGIKDPVRHADSVVRETQSSFFAEDISRFETGTPFNKALAMFSNYWIMNSNLLFTETVNNLRSDRGAFARAGRFMSVIILGFELPSIVSKAVLNLLSGDWDDDDDDTHIDELLNLVASANAQTAFSMIPYGGPVLAAAYGAAFTSQAYDDDIRFSPAASMIQSSIKSLGKVIKAEDMEARAEMLTGDKRVVRDLLNLLGLMTGTQIGALGKPLGYLMDVSQGKAEPENPLDVGRGLASGRAPRQ